MVLLRLYFHTGRMAQVFSSGEGRLFLPPRVVSYKKSVPTLIGFLTRFFYDFQHGQSYEEDR